MYSVIMTTLENLQDAERIIDALLNKKHAACAQIQQINSYYNFKGKRENQTEYLLYLKTKSSLYDKIEKTIKELRFKDYLNWIDDETNINYL